MPYQYTRTGTINNDNLVLMTPFDSTYIDGLAGFDTLTVSQAVANGRTARAANVVNMEKLSFKDQVAAGGVYTPGAFGVAMLELTAAVSDGRAFTVNYASTASSLRLLSNQNVVATLRSTSGLSNDEMTIHSVTSALSNPGITTRGSYTTDGFEKLHLTSVSGFHTFGNLTMTGTPLKDTLIISGNGSFSLGKVTTDVIDASTLNGGLTMREATAPVLSTSYVTIKGGNAADVLRGSTGKDNISGGTGNDTVYGNDGNDTIHGNDGDDVLDCSSAITIGASLYGDAGADILKGTQFADILDGGTGNDTVYGNGGNDTIHGNDGNDVLDCSSAITIGASLYGDAGADILKGTQFADILDGGIGNDIIYGNGGRDTIRGGDDNDALVLTGWVSQNAELYGGRGQDSFDFAAAMFYGEYGSYDGALALSCGTAQVVKIKDFNANEDVIRLIADGNPRYWTEFRLEGTQTIKADHNLSLAEVYGNIAPIMGTLVVHGSESTLFLVGGLVVNVEVNSNIAATYLYINKNNDAVDTADMLIDITGCVGQFDENDVVFHP